MALGGIRGIVLGGFCEHSAEVHRFVERAVAAGAAEMERVEGVEVGEAKAALRARFRRRLAVGAWRDFHSHLHARVPYINPSPAAEAKLLARRAEEERAWLDKRLAVRHRRLDEGESLAHRAGAGRGGGAGMSAGGSVCAVTALPRDGVNSYVSRVRG